MSSPYINFYAGRIASLGGEYIPAEDGSPKSESQSEPRDFPFDKQADVPPPSPPADVPLQQRVKEGIDKISVNQLMVLTAIVGVGATLLLSRRPTVVTGSSAKENGGDDLLTKVSWTRLRHRELNRRLATLDPKDANRVRDFVGDYHRLRFDDDENEIRSEREAFREARRLDGQRHRPAPTRPIGNCMRCGGLGFIRAYQHVHGGRCLRCGGTGSMDIEGSRLASTHDSNDTGDSS